jgi:hypothetical protein
VSPYACACVYVQAAASSKLQGAFACQPMPDWSGGIGRRLLAGGPSPCGRARRRRVGSRQGKEPAWPAGARPFAAEAPASERRDGRRLRKQWRADSEEAERWGGVFNCPEGMRRNAGDGGAVYIFRTKTQGNGNGGVAEY